MAEELRISRNVKLNDAGVRVYPVEEHAICPGRHTEKLIIGYGNVSEEVIEEGVRRLYSVLSFAEYPAGENNTRTVKTSVIE